METLKQFTLGQKLSTSSICDSDCIFRAEVIKRTAKTITILMYGKEERRGIKIYDNQETIHPLGVYSMCPTFRA